MGLVNTTFVKTLVDALTKIITLLDKITGGLGGFASSISKITLIFAAFKGGQLIFNKFA
jgi:hypothetical protein